MKKVAVILALPLLLAACSFQEEANGKKTYSQTLVGALKQGKEITKYNNERVKSINEEGELLPVVADPVPAQELPVIEKTYYPVMKVVDGDTIDVQIDGKVERLRLIGINTPETVDPRKPVECFGKEASAKAKELLTGEEVELESDPTQDDRDKYGRLLRYVTTKDGLFYNLEIIRQGYAYEYTYDVPYAHQKEFKAAQSEAKNSGKGLWADGACGQKNISR
jgi:micrococcal nuclease